MANVLTFGGVVLGPVLFVQVFNAFGSYGAAYLMLLLPALLGVALIVQGYRASFRGDS